MKNEDFAIADFRFSIFDCGLVTGASGCARTPPPGICNLQSAICNRKLLIARSLIVAHGPDSGAIAGRQDING